MPNAHLHDLLIDELRDMLSAEKQLLKGLKVLQASARENSLKKAFEHHHEETKGHIERLKEVFNSLDMAPRGKKCKAMEGLINEAQEIIEEFEGNPAQDAALISAAQKIEHYEIASYGCLVSYAKLMQHQKAEKLLEETLKEEKSCDKNLSKIAMQDVNEHAHLVA